MDKDFLKEQYFQILQYQNVQDQMKQEIECELKGINQPSAQQNFLSSSNNNYPQLQNINLSSQPYGQPPQNFNNYPYQPMQEQKYPSLDEYMQYQQSQNQDKDSAKFPNFADNVPFIVHKVKPTDTLFGISVQYDVPEQKIKAYNNLDTDEIYYRKELKIPNPRVTNNSPPEQTDEQSQKVIELQKIHYFKTNYLEKEDAKDSVAKYYLSSCNWEIDKAGEMYKQDLQYDKQFKNYQGNMMKKFI